MQRNDSLSADSASDRRPKHPYKRALRFFHYAVLCNYANFGAGAVKGPLLDETQISGDRAQPTQDGIFACDTEGRMFPDSSNGWQNRRFALQHDTSRYLPFGVSRISHGSRPSDGICCCITGRCASRRNTARLLVPRMLR